MTTITKEKADAVRKAADATANGGGELPGMPKRPELRSTNGRLVEHGSVRVAGGVSFDLRNQESIDYITSFKPGDEVELVVHGRVVDGGGDRSKLTKDGDTLIRRVAIAIDYIDGSPNEAALAALATAEDDAE